MLEVAPTSPPVPAPQRARGTGRLATKTRADASVIGTLYQDGCAKIRIPRTRSAALEAVLINTSGGLTGGDRLGWAIEAGRGSHAVVTTQACERVYRSDEDAAQVETSLTVGAGARLDWLPQETILFDAARLDRTLTVALAPDATFLGLEAVTLGRSAMGEEARTAALCDRWRVWRDGTLVHAEQNRLAASDMLARTNPALLDGAGAFATLCYLAPDAERRAETVAALLADNLGAGASLVGEKLIVRAVARNGYHLRKTIMPVIAALARDGAVPRLWTF